MKYIIDDKQLNAKTFIQFVNQIWLGNYDLPKTQNALTKTINITVWDNTIWVGCLRIFTNGCFFGTITELLVLPKYQKQEVGSKLLRLARENTPTMLFSAHSLAQKNFMKKRLRKEFAILYYQQAGLIYKTHKIFYNFY